MTVYVNKWIETEKNQIFRVSVDWVKGRTSVLMVEHGASEHTFEFGVMVLFLAPKREYSLYSQFY